MSLVLANEGKAFLLNLKQGTYNGGKIRLFTTGPTIDGSQTASSLNGYAPPCSVSASPSDTPNFGSATLVSNKGQMDATTVTFTFTGVSSPFDIAGYWVGDTGGSICYFAEERKVSGVATPVTIAADGDTFTVTMHYTEDTAP